MRQPEAAHDRERDEIDDAWAAGVASPVIALGVGPFPIRGPEDEAPAFEPFSQSGDIPR
jgi:hypothetical protein